MAELVACDHNFRPTPPHGYEHCATCNAEKPEFETNGGKWWAFYGGEPHHVLTDEEAAGMIWGGASLGSLIPSCEVEAVFS